jgi:uncharacterized protein YdeI (YjbR/CyaY-like superfamily)
MLEEKENSFYAKDRATWRTWLDEHQDSEKSVWLIIYHKDAGVPSVYYPEAVEEALCFGWIDSKPNKRDDKSYYQFFAKRNPKSNWSKVNKQKVTYLMEAGLMAPAGLQMIELAKQNGTWTALDEVDNRIIPYDLQTALNENAVALKNFMAFSRSSHKIILEWINNAKQPSTRQKRIEETVRLAAQNIKANHYRQ